MSWKFSLVRRVSELTCLPEKSNTDSDIIKITQVKIPAEARAAAASLQQLVLHSQLLDQKRPAVS